MNPKSRKVFTTGEFAKMHQINNRTLHYYDNIGLFSPAFRGENGYRYYTYLQSPNLEMLLAMRELNMSIEEISSYIDSPSSGSLQHILQKKTAEIDDTIKRLKQLKLLLEKKETQIVFSEKVVLDQIELVTIQKESIFLSSKFANDHEEDYLEILTKHMQEVKNHRLFNQRYGTMLSIEKIREENFDVYDYYYSIVEEKQKNEHIFLKPAGKYIQLFSKGNWEQLPSVYKKIKKFAKDNGLKLIGYAYEEGINEMAISDLNDYITQILIRYETN